MITPESNTLRNVAAIAEIVRKSPATTHINFRRDDEALIDVPLSQAEWTARQYPLWRVIDGGHPLVPLSVAVGHELPVLDVPPKPSETLTKTHVPPEEFTITPPLPTANTDAAVLNPPPPTAPVPVPGTAKKTAKKTAKRAK